MAVIHCPHCGSVDTQVGLHDIQCLGCGRASAYGPALEGRAENVPSPHAEESPPAPLNPATVGPTEPTAKVINQDAHMTPEALGPEEALRAATSAVVTSPGHSADAAAAGVATPPAPKAKSKAEEE